jgi:hypothetical protein
MSVVTQFKINKIIDKKIRNGVISYLINWKNYSNKENTWEKEVDLIHDGHQKELDKFNQLSSKKTSSRPFGVPTTPLNRHKKKEKTTKLPKMHKKKEKTTKLPKRHKKKEKSTLAERIQARRARANTKSLTMNQIQILF